MRSADGAGRRQHRLDTVLITFFVCALYAPHVDELVRSDDTRDTTHNEQRAPAPRPELDASTITAFPEAYTAYFDDTFGLRDFLLRGHSIEKYFLFGVSPTTQVVLGKDDWMFFTGDRSIEVYRGLAPFTADELEQWRRALESHHNFLRSRHIEHVVAFAPNKESIYPDYMPRRLNRVSTETRLDQLTAYMQAHSDVRILDLRPLLDAARSEDAPGSYVYFQLGTHWNGRGDYVAYRAIMDWVAGRFPRAKPLARSELESVEVPGCGDSWASKMYIADLLPQREIEYAPHDPPRARVVRDSPWGMLRQHIMEVDDASLPRAVMLHDSFGAYVDRLLAEHFSRLACYWQYDFDTRLIAAEQPDVVIELYVERTLCNVYAPDFKAHPIDRGEEAFRASERVLYALDAARDAPLVRPQGRAQVRLTHDDAGSALVIDTRSEGDTVVLPDFEFASGERAVLHFDIASPDATDMYVLYKRAGEDEYSRRNNCVVQLRKGENRGYAVVDDTNLRGALCIRPGGSAGPYTLRAFEVRALPAQ